MEASVAVDVEEIGRGIVKDRQRTQSEWPSREIAFVNW